MITETAHAPRPSTRRPKRLGDGMLTPVEVLEFRNPQTGRVELMRPGRDRVSVHWFGYRKHPEPFTQEYPIKAWFTQPVRRETAQVTAHESGRATLATLRPLDREVSNAQEVIVRGCGLYGRAHGCQCKCRFR